MMTLGSTIITFPAERLLFLKETTAKLYGILPYYLGKSIIELPFIVLFPLIFGLISYYICGFNPGVGNYFFFIAICMLMAFNGNSLGIMTGCMFNDAKVSMAIMPLIIIPFMLFGGFYLNRDDYPVWLGWIEWISPFKYAVEALVHNEFDSYNKNVINYLGMNFGMWPSFGMLFVLGIAYRMFGYVFLKSLLNKLQ